MGYFGKTKSTYQLPRAIIILCVRETFFSAITLGQEQRIRVHFCNFVVVTLGSGNNESYFPTTDNALLRCKAEDTLAVFQRIS